MAEYTLKFRAYTSREGYGVLEEALALLRRLYNDSLAERKLAWDEESRSVSKAEQSEKLKYRRADDPRYGGMDRYLQTGVLDRLDKAYQAFFGRVKRGEKPGHPRYKAQPRFRTIELSTVTASQLRVDGQKAYLAVKGLPPMEIRHKGRMPLPVPVEGAVTAPKLNKKTGKIIHKGGKPKKAWAEGTRPRAAKITLRGRRLFVSFSYRGPKPTLPPTGRAVGIDMGVNKRFATSDGFASPEKETRRSAEKDKEYQARLKKEQRRQAAMRERARAEGRAEWREVSPGKFRHYWLNAGPDGPSRYRESRAIAQNLMHRHAISKEQEIHRLTTEIVRRYDVIAVEKLKLKNMTRSAAGTAEEPGTGVSAKRGLNRSILEKNLGEFRRQLAYKAEWAGRQYGEVNPAFTSQTCNECGYQDSRNRRGEVFRCLSCGRVADADVNAARNILHRLLETLPGYDGSESLSPAAPRQVDMGLALPWQTPNAHAAKSNRAGRVPVPKNRGHTLPLL